MYVLEEKFLGIMKISIEMQVINNTGKMILNNPPVIDSSIEMFLQI